MNHRTFKRTMRMSALCLLSSGLIFAQEGEKGTFERLTHHTPNSITDLGVGLWGWPFPYDVNKDGKADLVLISGSSPARGTYYFENTGRKDPTTGADIFKKGVYIGSGHNDLTPSYMPDGSMRVLGPGFEAPNFLKTGTRDRVPLGIDEASIHTGRLRGKQWSYVDYDQNGVFDLIVGIGDWSAYDTGAGYDENGRWQGGPLRGYIYVLRNTGTNDEPHYGSPERIQIDGLPLEVYGMPSPVFGEFLQDGKQHLICGEFVDGLTFFENVGTATEPKFSHGKRLRYKGEALTIPLCMMVVVGYDWNGDGLKDLVIAQEDGRVAVLENTGKIVDGMPEFLPPRFFRQEADAVKFGALSTPSLVDWDGDGRQDILAGNSAGEIAFIKNLGGNPVRWAEAVKLDVDDKPIRFMAGANGSIQGPAEAKWGYTNISTGDWDGDGLPDIMVNDITGRVYWFKNLGAAVGELPKLAPAQKVRVNWKATTPQWPAWNWWEPVDDELVVQWRCTPLIVQLPDEERPSLVSVDAEGFLSVFRQQVGADGTIRVLPPAREFFLRNAEGKVRPLRLTRRTQGGSGRRTYVMTDWDGDGKLDIIVNGINANFLKNISTEKGRWVFEDMGPLSEIRLAYHNTAPAVGRWDDDGKQKLLLGAEDGFFYEFIPAGQPAQP